MTFELFVKVQGDLQFLVDSHIEKAGAPVGIEFDGWDAHASKKYRNGWEYMCANYEFRFRPKSEYGESPGMTLSVNVYMKKDTGEVELFIRQPVTDEGVRLDHATALVPVANDLLSELRRYAGLNSQEEVGQGWLITPDSYTGLALLEKAKSGGGLHAG